MICLLEMLLRSLILKHHYDSILIFLNHVEGIVRSYKWYQPNGSPSGRQNSNSFDYANAGAVNDPPPLRLNVSTANLTAVWRELVLVPFLEEIFVWSMVGF